MTEKLHSIKLTDEEIIRLDGIPDPRPALIVEIGAARARRLIATLHDDLTDEEVALVQKAVSTAASQGILVWRHTSIGYCLTCKESGGYAPYKRSGHSQRAGWYKKGDPNLAKPRTLSAVELRHSFMSFQGHVRVGACSTCMTKLLPALRASLADVRAELPERLAGPVTYRRVDLQHCTKCDWKGRQDHMRMLPALTRGMYPGGCPNCEAENQLFETLIKGTGEHVIVEADTPKETT